MKYKYQDFGNEEKQKQRRKQERLEREFISNVFEHCMRIDEEKHKLFRKYILKDNNSQNKRSEFMTAKKKERSC